MVSQTGTIWYKIFWEQALCSYHIEIWPQAASYGSLFSSQPSLWKTFRRRIWNDYTWRSHCQIFCRRRETEYVGGRDFEGCDNDGRTVQAMHVLSWTYVHLFSRCLWNLNRVVIADSCSYTYAPAQVNMLLSDSFGREGGTYVIDVKPEFLKYFLAGSEY